MTIEIESTGNNSTFAKRTFVLRIQPDSYRDYARWKFSSTHQSASWRMAELPFLQTCNCQSVAAIFTYLIHTKLIQFLGIVALLLVFEFLSLLLHPFLERITHHSPILMLLGLVCIAALLVPLHHKLEKWATPKLVEKNKRIRLAAAKKTIQELETKPDHESE